MASNTAKERVIELGGCKFRRVKSGLDEAQVASFINELINQRDTVLQAQEHLSSLTKLAEKTVVEADKLAQEIKTEATEQAKVEATAVIAKAEEQAQQMIEEKRSEIVAVANEEAVAIKAEAERKAKVLRENEKRNIQGELSNFVHRVCSQLLSELESLKEQVVALQVESGHKLSQPEEETGPATLAAGEINDEFLELIQATDQTNTEEPEWELEILPPIYITKMMDVVTYLDQLPEVENTEIIPRIPDRPSIAVYLRESIDLIEVLRTLPDVAQVKEDVTDNAGADGKPRKVQIVLSRETMPQEDK